MIKHASFICGLLLVASSAYANEHITYVPIMLDDLTIIIPVFDKDSNDNGIPDYDDPFIDPLSAFGAVCSALATHNIAAAVLFFSPGHRARYERAFFELGPKALKVCSELTNVQVLNTTIKMRELSAQRVVDGDVRAYVLTQMRDPDLVFRFTEF
jgi:hypothetical protein